MFVTRRAQVTLFLAAVVACGKAAPPARADSGDSTFVGAMADLEHLLESPPPTGVGLDSARRAILQRRGLTAEALERMARDLAAEPEHAASVFRAIDRELLRRRGQ